MKDNEPKKSYKAVEEKTPFWKSDKSESKTDSDSRAHAHAESKPKLIAKKSIRISRGDSVWSVNAGDDVSNCSPNQLAILKNNGVI